MHIPDGVLSPAVCATTGVFAASAVGYSLYRLRDSLAEKAVPLTGMVAALIFAGQMVNFPLPLLPVSGHLLGGVLAAAIVGPWSGCIAVTLVLLVQCAVFADGGVTSLGANILHMAVIGSWGGYAVYSAIRKASGDRPIGTLTGVAAASWLSVMAAAAMFCIEFRFSHPQVENFQQIFLLMVGYHALIGIGEALITGLVVAFVLRQQPDLIRAPEKSSLLAGLGRLFAAGLVVSLAVAALLAPFASEHPDGLDAVSEKFIEAKEVDPPATAVIPDYKVPPPVASWGEKEWWPKLSTAAAGIFGTTFVLILAVVLGRLMGRRPPVAGSVE